MSAEVFRIRNWRLPRIEWNNRGQPETPARRPRIRSCRQRSGIHGKQEKQGTTEHTETTEAGHKRREDRFRVFRVFRVFCG